jgi:hypothetical protein
VEEGILPVVFETVDADELDDEGDEDELDEDDDDAEDEDDEEEEELDEDNAGLDALFSCTAVLISSMPALGPSILGPASFSTFLLFPPPSITEAEAEADLFRAELSALKRILIISSSPFPSPTLRRALEEAERPSRKTYVITSFSSTTSRTRLPANNSNPSISSKMSLVDGAVSRTVERDCRICFFSSEIVEIVVGIGRRSFDSLNGASSWRRTRILR